GALAGYAQVFSRLWQLAADRNPGHHQVAAEVALHQHAHGVLALRCNGAARARSDAALPAERDRARARADGAFAHLGRGCAFERLHHVPGPQWPRADIVEEAVVGLTDHR